jgi:hypothetical protein
MLPNKGIPATSNPLHSGDEADGTPVSSDLSQWPGDLTATEVRIRKKRRWTQNRNINYNRQVTDHDPSKLVNSANDNIVLNLVERKLESIIFRLENLPP